MQIVYYYTIVGTLEQITRHLIHKNFVQTGRKRREEGRKEGKGERGVASEQWVQVELAVSQTYFGT